MAATEMQSLQSAINDLVAAIDRMAQAMVGIAANMAAVRDSEMSAEMIREAQEVAGEIEQIKDRLASRELMR